MRCLKRNGRLFFLHADRTRLHASAGRPLCDTEEKCAGLYADRMALYRSTADVVVPDLGSPEAEAAYILAKRME